MRLISLEIHGFKSFADSQRLVFPSGMTAVVGPNGCGKSNISDALAWALGEQRASLLRGAEMADVVFAGTSARKAMGMAEVSLVMEMDDHYRPQMADGPRLQPPVPTQPHQPGAAAKKEVTVSRRLFRDSSSEYRINGRECRLRDIQDLLMDTGMGTRAYSFIQQGQIDQILSAKPKDRRQLLEEAAGITRYKARRAEAERRLLDTSANLQRLDDILFELGKQQDSLKRQAARTRRAVDLEQGIKAVQRILLTGKALELETAKESVAQSLDGLDAQVALLTAQAAEKASEVERRRLSLAEMHSLNEKRAQQIRGMDSKLGLLGQERGFQESLSGEAAGAIEQALQRLAALSDKGGDWTFELARLGKAVEEAQTELDAREKRVREAEESIALAGGGLRAIESDLRAKRARKADAEQMAAQRQKARNAILSQIAQIEGRLDTLNHEEATRGPRLDGLKSDLRRVSGEAEGAEERLGVMQEAIAVQAARHCEAVDALRTCERAHREAEGGVGAEELRLRQLSDALKAAGGSAANEEALEWLRGRGERPTALADALKIDEESRPDLERVLGAWINTVAWMMDAGALKQLPGQLTTSLAQAGAPVTAPGQARPIAASIRWRAKAPKVLGGLLARVFQCSDDAFVELAVGHPDLAFVSPSFVKLPFGPVQVGVEPPKASPLKMLAEMDAARAAREAMLDRLDALEEEKKSLLARASDLQGSLAEMQDDGAGAKRSLEDAKGLLASIRRQIGEAEEAQRRADSQWGLYEGEMAQLKAKVREMDEERHEGAEQALDAEIGAAEQRQMEAQTHLEERREILMGAAMAREAAWSERDSAERQLQHLQRAAFDLEAEKKRIASEIEEKEARRAAAAGRASEIERETQGLLDDRLKVSNALSDAQPRMEQAADSLRMQERMGRDLQESLENARQLRQEAMIQAAEVHGSMEAVAKEVELALGMGVPDFLASITVEEREAWGQGELVHQTRLAELQSRRLDLGSVNPLAIQELEEAESRLGFMNDQRADVLEAIGNLEATIKEINATSEERFREAFDFINSRFQEVFRQVFGGGSAQMSLQDPKDLLECGIEIMAQPPGKTAKVLTLLSGGEKALAAISLLFAIFHFKPSPFCVLDEVDAPLDEANVGRFAALVKNMKEHTQFIVITHQKPTMMAADTLYGVTMEEKGISRLVSVQLKEAEKMVV